MYILHFCYNSTSTGRKHSYISGVEGTTNARGLCKEQSAKLTPKFDQHGEQVRAEGRPTYSIIPAFDGLPRNIRRIVSLIIPGLTPSAIRSPFSTNDLVAQQSFLADFDFFV